MRSVCCSRPPPAHTPLPTPTSSALPRSTGGTSAHDSVDAPAARLARDEARTAIGGGDEGHFARPGLFHHVVLARFWLLPARCYFSQIQYPGRRLFHKQSPEFCIECHTATILAGCTEFIGRVSSNTIRRDSPFWAKR